ncbi:hypothetical protein KCP77_02045 [Salmonella enterica subsp. enterica]|nr:hypothetical protein KCP77_02045 [Salmonella enterica subsp. enterica]
MRAAPEDLSALKLPAQSRNMYWRVAHLPWGPLAVNIRGRQARRRKSGDSNGLTLQFAGGAKTGHASWVSGWAPGESIK